MKRKMILLYLTICLVIFGFFSQVQMAVASNEPENTITTYASESAMVTYSCHIQKNGWTGTRYNGDTGGTVGSGLRMEALKVNVSNIRNYNGSVLYRSHIQSYGWENKWRSNGEVSGTEGYSKRLEAIQIILTGDLANKFDIYYRVHVETFGWLDWASNGKSAGTEGYSKRIEAIQIVLVDQGKNAPGETGYPFMNASKGVTYSTHVQTLGWQEKKTNGILAGTEGKSKRLEAIAIDLANCPYDGSVEYQCHVQTDGWEKEWKSNGEIAGSEGHSKRLEAIRIRLTGELAGKCDIYYRVHCQGYGWLGWVSNGKEAGTSGFSYRLESIQILILPKNARSFSNTTGYICKADSHSVPEWDISDITTSVEDGVGWIDKSIDFTVQLEEEYNSEIMCEFSWENNSTGETGVIETVAPGEIVRWTPKISGKYTITVTATDLLQRTRSKQIHLQINRPEINKEDAYFIAHRGLKSQAPDNSIPAFELAGENGFDAIETDISETKDGHFVISHNMNLSDVCGKNVNISDLTYDELRDYSEYYIVSGNNVNQYSEEQLRIPTLEEYLEICYQYGCDAVVDLKNINSVESVSRIFEITSSYGMQDRVSFTSYNNLFLQAVREIDPDVQLWYGISSSDYFDYEWLINYNIDVTMEYSILLYNDCNHFLDKGIKVGAYTVNNKETAGILLDKGVRYITTECILWE